MCTSVWLQHRGPVKDKPGRCPGTEFLRALAVKLRDLIFTLGSMGATTAGTEMGRSLRETSKDRGTDWQWEAEAESLRQGSLEGQRQ